MLTETELLKRVKLCSRLPAQTYATLPEEEQDVWRGFFFKYGVKVQELTEEESRRLCGAFAHVFSIAHEYYRYYGPVWPAAEKKEVKHD